MQLLLRVTPNAEHDSWSGYALLKLTKDCLKHLAEERELLQMVKSRDKGACELYFWSGIETYFVEDGAVDFDDFLTQVEVSLLESNEQLVLADEREMEFDEDNLTSVDCEQVCFAEDGLHLLGYACDTISVSSITITYDRLAQWLTRG